MACPTCDHTLQTVFADKVRTVRWCPRCGTLQSVLCGHEDTAAPKVVECLRSFARSVSSGQAVLYALESGDWGRADTAWFVAVDRGLQSLWHEARQGALAERRERQQGQRP